MWSAFSAAAAPAAIAGNIGTTLYQNYENKKESARDRDFQERMSSTAYQRSVRDMKAAGLNPMLAFDKGGASTPGGSKANLANPGEQLASSALQLKRINQEVKLLEAQTKKTESEKTNIDQNLIIKRPGASAAGSIQNMIEAVKDGVPSIENNVNSARSFMTDLFEYLGRKGSKIKQFDPYEFTGSKKK